MIKYVLVTRPEYDYTTRYISAWSQKIIIFAESKGNLVIDLLKDRATKKEFESVVHKKNPSFVIINGHGNDQSVCGQDGDVLIEAGVNDDILNSRIVYALSCRSAKILGPESIKSGALAYIGYVEDFIFMYSNEKRGHPIDDKTAELFLEPSNQIVISLLKGHTAGEAHQGSKKFFLRNIQKLLTSESSSIESSALRYLFWDMKYQVCLGDQSATL